MTNGKNSYRLMKREVDDGVKVGLEEHGRQETARETWKGLWIWGLMRANMQEISRYSQEFCKKQTSLTGWPGWTVAKARIDAPLASNLTTQKQSVESVNAKNTWRRPIKPLTAGYFDQGSRYLFIVCYQLDRTHPFLPLYRAGTTPMPGLLLSERALLPSPVF